MKTFCLLLLGIVAYVSASKHHCDPLAANTVYKEEEKDDLVLSLKEFTQNEITEYFVTEASPSKENESSAFCTAPTHGTGCEAVGYWRRIIGKPSEDNDKGADELEILTVFVGVSGAKKNAIVYHMTIEGINEDDYIFKMKEGTSVTAKKVGPNGEIVEQTVQVPPNIAKVLESEFALFYYSKTDHFAIYITCDGRIMWISYLRDRVNTETGTPLAQPQEMKDWVAKLVKIAQEEKGVTPTALSPVTTKMSENYTKYIAAPPAA